MDYKPLRCSERKREGSQLLEFPITWTNFLQHIHWVNTSFIVILPLSGLILAHWVNPKTETLVFAFLYHLVAGLGVTAGILTSNDLIRLDCCLQ